MFPIPDDFLHGPFERQAALDGGIPARVLEGRRFRRLHKGVYCHRDHATTWQDLIAAAQLALPPEARTTGATRIQQLGLDVGNREPVRFVVQGDLHLDLNGVFLHRTVKMPPHCGEGVSNEAAFIAYCAEARTIDAIKAGSVLLHRVQLDLQLLDQLMTEEKWRRGVAETAYVLPFLDGRCRSMAEAELLTLFVFAGLPMPDVNIAIEVAPGVELTPDFRFANYGQVVEYEGGQHQDDRAQYVADIDRYALYRRHDVPYELITKERMRSPKATVRLVHAALAVRGYDGPPPDFGEQWDTLFRALSDVVRLKGAASTSAVGRWGSHVPAPRNVAPPPPRGHVDGETHTSGGPATFRR